MFRDFYATNEKRNSYFIKKQKVKLNIHEINIIYEYIQFLWYAIYRNFYGI